MREERGQALLLTAVLTALALLPAASAGACPSGPVPVPGAEQQTATCLADLTTAGTVPARRTDQSDWLTLHARGTVNPTGVPGLQIDGNFPDTSSTNTTNGTFSDSQFVLRLPDTWNGGLVITGAPGVRKQYANDFIISDWVLSKGYAYASTDKGNTGIAFYNDGEQPGDAIAEWHRRVTELTIAAKEAVLRAYGRAPERTVMTGISNGGYLTRHALEHHPELYDGGVDWEGTLMLADGPNLLTYLPPALKHFARYRAGDEAARKAILDAGFEPGSEFLWEDHYAEYWDLTQRTYREELDPAYDGAITAGVPFCQSGTPMCDADYDFGVRRPFAGPAIAKAALTGRIGKPMLTLHGTYDALLPIRTDSDVYARMVAEQGRAAMHRYYVFEAGNHVDSRFDRYGRRIRPLLPCYRDLFEAWERWVFEDREPPPSQFVENPAEGDVVNACSGVVPAAPKAAPAAGQGASAAPAPAPATPASPFVGGPSGSAADRRLRPRALSLRLARARDRRAPYRFRVTGRLTPPQGVRRCSGSLRLTARRVTRRVSLRRNCTYAATVVVRRSRPGPVRFVARYPGSGSLQPVTARARRGRAG